MQVAVVGQGDGIGDLETRLGAARFCHRDRPVQLNHGRAGKAGELSVQRCDLRPVARLVGMEGGDRRLHDVDAATVQRKSALEHGLPGGDLRRIPERAVLLVEQDELAVPEARLAPGVVQQHHRQQPVHLGLVGHQLGECAAEPEGLGGQVSATPVALVENQVHDREHGREPIGKQLGGGHAKRDSGGLDLVLCSHQPLGHRRLGNQEGAGDLGRSSARPGFGA